MQSEPWGSQAADTTFQPNKDQGKNNGDNGPDQHDLVQRIGWAQPLYDAVAACQNGNRSHQAQNIQRSGIKTQRDGLHDLTR